MQPLIDADIEKWVVVERHYQISNLGRLYSGLTGRYLKGYVGKNGYKYYTFWDGTREYAHRLVAKAFIPNPNELPHVNHLDHDPSNNNILNLEWCTHQQNMQHSYTNPKRGRPTPYKHPNCKLLDSEIVAIYKSDLPKRQLARLFKVDPKTIHNIKLKGKHKHIIDKEVAYDSAIDRR